MQKAPVMTRKKPARRRKVWAIYRESELMFIEHQRVNLSYWRHTGLISNSNTRYRIVPGTFLPDKPKPRRRK